MEKSIQHPCHPHVLNLRISNNKKARFLSNCIVCGAGPEDPAYSCKKCRVFIHPRCARLPTPLERHPYHCEHPLELAHAQPEFQCSLCPVSYKQLVSKYGCADCGFDLHVHCALLYMPDDVESPENADLRDKMRQSVISDAHEHPLTPFLYNGYPSFCSICRNPMDEVGQMCTNLSCWFVVHERCIRRLYYEDGSRIPRVAHEHQLIAFQGKGNSLRCKNCHSEVSGEYVGCSECKLYYHRHCVEALERLDYPPHPEHPLTLTLVTPSIATGTKGARTPSCQSCGMGLLDQVIYGCSSDNCGFFLHIGCALSNLKYCRDGAESEVNIPWHDHPLVLCHCTSPCSACGNTVEGHGYVCSVAACGLLLHTTCTKLMSEIQQNPYHPKHPLVLVPEASKQEFHCDVCHEEIVGFRFSCPQCDFSLHVRCASKVPERKHVLHGHKLTYFEELPHMQCNVCGERRHSALFRCVPCDFNIHQECMSLQESVKHKNHLHKLFLRDSYLEDDSGEYYCDICGCRRNPDLGAYVCKECKSDNLFIAHIECALSRVSKTRPGHSFLKFSLLSNAASSSSSKACVEMIYQEMFLRTCANPALQKLDQRIGKLERKLVELEVVKKELEEAKKERLELVSKQQCPEYSIT